MRIAVFYDQDYKLRPLMEASILGVIDEEQKVIEQYENPALEMGEEAAIEGLRLLGVKAIVVNRDTLSSSAYRALKGSLLFMLTSYTDLYQLIDKLEEVKGSAKSSIEFMEGQQEAGS